MRGPGPMHGLVKNFRRIAALALTATVAALTLSVSANAATTRMAVSCGAGANGSAGYGYAGHQGSTTAYGVRATITQTAAPIVAAGHVAGWVGVGGPGQGPNGETEWLQVGLATMPGSGTQAYAEITVPGKDPEYRVLAENVQVGESHEVAVLEAAGKAEMWRVWLDGKPMTEPILLPGSHKRWEPIVTGESYNDQQSVCNTFGYRFDRVSIASAQGGAWKPFAPGYDFLDQGFSVKQVSPAQTGAKTRALASDSSYAFDATTNA